MHSLRKDKDDPYMTALLAKRFKLIKCSHSRVKKFEEEQEEEVAGDLAKTKKGATDQDQDQDRDQDVIVDVRLPVEDLILDPEDCILRTLSGLSCLVTNIS